MNIIQHIQPYPMQPKRKTQRKKEYDYSQPGYYSVTICTQLRSCLFGAIQNGEMLANGAGQMVQDTWHEIPTYYPGIGLDVMQIIRNEMELNNIRQYICNNPIEWDTDENNIDLK